MAQEVYVKSSEIYVSREPASILTVVGSCIAVCLFDHEMKLGGMNHFLLPTGDRAEGELSGKFGNVAIPELLRRLVELGANKGSVVAKIAGGASILSISNVNHLPGENIKSADRALAILGIPVVGRHVGGNKGRKVEFDTETGRVLINGSRLI